MYDEGKLVQEATHKKFLSVRQEGNRQVQRNLEFYNLDMIISVGYRVKSMIATRFFSVIQNKLHFSATGMTAAELIHSRVDHLLPNMGLTTWKGGEVRKTDVTIAKNYLQKKEIEELNLIVTMWLDFAEDQAKRRKQVFMKHWEQKLDDFLRFNERRVLPDTVKVSKQAAEGHARTEYEKFEVRRREYKELVGEADYVKQLENAVRQLPENKRANEEKSSGCGVP
jgi:hypothetical protein